MSVVIPNSGVKLPVGLRFRPTDEKILEYLYHKIHGLQYYRRNVFDFDLYGVTEPWAIWGAHKLVDDDEDLYFFTKLKRSTIKNSAQLSAHIDRKIGSAGGTWSGENSASSVFNMVDERVILGYRKRFRYENPNIPEHHGEWIMHEYSLHENLIREGAIDPDYVLCRMRKNERPKRKAKKMCFPQPMMNNNKKILALGRSQMRIKGTYSRNIDDQLQAATTYQEVSLAPNEMTTNQLCSNNYYDDINKAPNDISHMPEMMNTNNQDSGEDFDFIMSLKQLLENDLQADQLEV